MVLKKFLTGSLLLLLLTSCSPARLDVTTMPLSTSIVQPAPPRPVELSSIDWSVINYENNIFYGLSVSDYELLSLNMQEIIRYISEQQNIINYYQELTQ